MVTEAQIDATLKELFDNIYFSNEPKGLYDPLRYMISIGGKRIRPRLCLTTYSLFKDTFDEGILQPAAGLEVVHSFTLIHDDIMDKSPLRRGQNTVWKKWNEDTAILSGDVMCIDSYRRICKAPSDVLASALKLFTTTAMQVCEGQQYDMDFQADTQVSMEDYMKMIGLKTAVLIACSAKMGAIIGRADEQACANFYDYGYALGLAFQVADDYLDVFGDEKVFGKPIGGDILNNKKSWLITRALQKADQVEGISDKLHKATKIALLKAMAQPVETAEQRAEKIAKVKELYVEMRVDEDAKYEIVRLNDKALEFARKLNLGKVGTEILVRFAEKLIGRAK